MEPYVRRLTRVLDHRLGWHRSRLKLMARMVRAAIETRTTNLAEWAVPIKPQVQTDSTYRRIQAFFEKFTPDYEDLGRFLLDLVPTDPPHVIVLDRTEWHFGSEAMNALVAGPGSPTEGSRIRSPGPSWATRAEAERPSTSRSSTD